MGSSWLRPLFSLNKLIITSLLDLALVLLVPDPFVDLLHIELDLLAELEVGLLGGAWQQLVVELSQPLSLKICLGQVFLPH